MKMNQLSITTFFMFVGVLIALEFLVVPTSQAYYWIRPQYLANEVQWKGQYLSTEENFTSSGSYYEKLPRSQYMKNVFLNFEGRWILFPRWGLNTMVQLAASESLRKETDQSTTKRSNSQFCCLGASLDYQLLSYSYMEIYPIFSFQYPLIRNKLDTYNVALSEGALEMTAQILTRLRMGLFIPYAHIGFTYRDEGRSALMPYSLGIEWEGKTVNIGSVLHGYSSVTKDAHSQDTQERNTFLDQANGGSRLFYSTNPDLLDLEFYGSLQHSPTWRSLLGFAISINGSQSARSARAYMGMNIQYGGGASGRAKAKSKTHMDEVFREDIENVIDQRLFEEQKK